MKDTCWRLFAFSSIDHKAAQAWLDRWAKKGWALVRLHGPFVKLRRTERTDLAYFLDWTDSYYSEPGDYVQICADAGWELRESTGNVNIYISRPGVHPLPIQTDPEVEYQRLREKVLRRMGISTLGLAFISLFLFMMISGHGPSNFVRSSLTSSNLLSFFLLSLPLLLPAFAFHLVSLGAGVLAWKEAALVGEAPPLPRSWALKLRRVLGVLGHCYSLLTILLFLTDALLGNMDTTFGISIAVGTAIGGGLSWKRYKKGDPKRRHALRAPFLAVLYLLCFLLGGVIRDVRPHYIPSGPLLGTVMDRSGPTHADTFLGSQARWGEYVADPLRPGHSTSFDVDVRVCRSPRLTGLVFGPIPADMAPVDGMEGVWRTADANPTYLIRRGDAQLTISPQVLIVSLHGITFDIGPDRSQPTGVDTLSPSLDWLERWSEVRP